MKHYHYAVYVPVNDDGTMGRPELDESMNDFGVSSDVTVWDTDTDTWETPDENLDCAAIEHLARTLTMGTMVTSNPAVAAVLSIPYTSVDGVSMVTREEAVLAILTSHA